MIYQFIVRRLQELKEQGVDIGNSISFCTENILDLIDKHEKMAVSLPALVNICLDNK